MFSNILEYIKHPVTSTLEKLEQENLKSSGVKSLILSAVIGLISVISTYISITSRYSKDSWYASYYTETQLRKMKTEAIQDAELFANFFKTTFTVLIAIAIVALILYIIGKLLKSSIEYKDTLSLINSVLLVYIVGLILSVLLAKIYAPLGLILLLTTGVYTLLTFINAFRDALYIEDVDKFVLVSTGVIVVVVVLLVLILYNNISSVFSILS